MIDALFTLTSRLALDDVLAAIAAASLRASLLLLAALAMTLAWRGASAATRHLVWTLALGGALLVPFASRMLPAFGVRYFPSLAALEDAPVATADARMTALAAAGARGLPLDASPAVGTPKAATVHETVPVLRGPGVTPWHQTAAAMAAANEAAVRRGAIGPRVPYQVSVTMPAGSPRPDGSPAAPRWRSLLAALWALGASLVLVPVMLGRLHVLLLARRARPLGKGAWSDLVDVAIARTGLARDVRVLESPDSTMPMTWGVVKPVVLLPADAERWTDQQRQDVLLHELAHVARLDCLTQLVAQLACAVYWFNPLVWLAARRMCVEREHACDDRVLAAGTRPSDYASHLLEVARTMRTGSVAPLGAVAMARRAQLSERLIAVLDARRPRSGVSRRVALPAWIAAAALVLLVGALAPAGADAAGAPQRTGMSDPAASDTDSVAAVSGGSGSGSASGVAVGGGQGGSGSATATVTQADGPATAVSGSGTTGGASASFTVGRTSVTVSGGQSVVASDGVVKVDGQVVLDSKGGDGLLKLGPAATASPELAAAAARAPRDECGDAKGSSSHINVDDGGRKEMRVSWKSERCSVSIEIEGDVTLAPDLTDIVSLAPGAYVEITERSDRSVRRLEMRNRGGQAERKYSVDGDARAWDAEGRRWLATLLVDLERRTGSFAKQRVAQLHASGGASAVLAEIDRLSADYARRRYFTELFALDAGMDDATLARAIAQAAGDIDSDYELRVVLAEAAEARQFGAASTTAFANAVRSLGSDYERRVAVTALLGRGTLPTSALRTVLSAAKGMSSSYEMRVILTALAKQRALDAEAIGLYADAVASMSSDYERRVALVAILDRDLDDRSLAALFRATREMRSDYERRVVLTAAVKNRALEGEALREFDAAVDAMSSDYERGVVLNAARRGRRTSDM